MTFEEWNVEATRMYHNSTDLPSVPNFLQWCWNTVTAAQRKEPQPCGHPVQAIQSTDEGTSYCGWCADVARPREALREIIDTADGWGDGETLDIIGIAEAVLFTPADESKCGTCGDTGEVDSGAPDPQGNFIDVPCPECAVDSTTWLPQHHAGVRREERERCLTRRFPIPMRRICNVLSPMCSDEDDKAVRAWLDNIADAIREQEPSQQSPERRER